jgi:hypothetical protein
MAAKKSVEKPDAVVEEVKELRFTKEQFLASEQYQERRDAVNALLDDSKEYTKEEVETIIQSFMTGEERKGE